MVGRRDLRASLRISERVRIGEVFRKRAVELRWIVGYLSENADKDIYQRDIEKHFTIARSTASKVLRLMEEKGLIQRQPVAHDARLKKIVLTQKAYEIKGLMREDSEIMERTLTQGFTEEELKTLHSYIQRMKENITNIKSAL